MWHGVILHGFNLNRIIYIYSLVNSLCKKMGTSGGVDPPLFAAFFLDDMIYIAAMSIE